MIHFKNIFFSFFISGFLSIISHVYPPKQATLITRKYYSFPKQLGQDILRKSSKYSMSILSLLAVYPHNNFKFIVVVKIFTYRFENAITIINKTFIRTENERSR